MNLKKYYYQQQFENVLTQTGQYKMKITSDKGQTKWINLSLEQLEKIADIMTGDQ